MRSGKHFPCLGRYEPSSLLYLQGLKATKDKPNPYLYQALALMATELRYTEEARQWFLEGTKTIMVSLPMLLKLCHFGHHACTVASVKIVEL